MTKLRGLTLACLAVAMSAAIAGCGSSGGNDPLAADDVSTIITQATANTINAQSFTITGGTSATLSMDLTIVRDLGCTGTIVQGSTRSKFIWIGNNVYAQTAAMPANQWMKGTSTASNLQGLLNLCRPSSLLAALAASAVNTATRSVTTYDGQPALSLSLPAANQANSKPSLIVVTDTQTPLLLNVSEPGAVNFTFTGYGAVKTIAPPAVS